MTEATEPAGEGWLPRPAAELFGAEARAAEAYQVLTVDVPAERWPEALRTARDELGCGFFDWLSAVDQGAAGVEICAHVVAWDGPGRVRRLLLRTALPAEAPSVATATGVYPGAAWHERETHEMFGVDFPGHPGLTPLLLPDGFEGHPLRKDFVLAARVVKAWPGAKEPGESEHGGPKRRQMLPPGVPDPNEWGPLKGQLPDAPARGRARRARPASSDAAEAPAARAERPRRPRRTRSASEGSASQRAAAERAAAAADEAEGAESGRSTGGGAEAPAGEPAPAGAERPARPRRTRSASEGSASQRAAAERTAAAADETAEADEAAGADGARSAGAGAGAVAPDGAESAGGAGGADGAHAAGDAGTPGNRTAPPPTDQDGRDAEPRGEGEG